MVNDFKAMAYIKIMVNDFKAMVKIPSWLMISKQWYITIMVYKSGLWDVMFPNLLLLRLCPHPCLIHIVLRLSKGFSSGSRW